MWLKADGVILPLEGPHPSGEALTRSITVLQPGVMNLAWRFLLETSCMLEVQCFSGGTIAILGEMVLGDMTDLPRAGYLVSSTLAQSRPLATSSHCEKQNQINKQRPPPPPLSKPSP